MRRAAAAATALVMLGAVAACGDDDSADATDGDPAEQDPDTPTPTTDPDLDDLSLTLTEVAAFDEPLDLIGRPDDDDLFVAERDGRVFRITVEGEGPDRTYRPDDEPIIDLGDEVVTDFEKGLLGIEFSPDGDRLYLSYSLAPDGDTRVVSYEYAGPPPDTTPDDEGDDDETDATGPIDPATRREVLAVDQPYGNHNGGQIRFGPDGYLYVGLGDGGSSGDPEGHGQDTDTLLGALLRIDPESTVETGEPYAIPEDNPFADDGGRPEIWAYGLRNPWRFSFDAVTGDLWIADVGQNEWEEINLLPAADEGGRGANLEWNEMEGLQPFEDGGSPPDGVPPVFDYPNPDDGCSVTGGYVYSGRNIPALDAVYLFGDFCEPTIRALTVDDGEVTGETWLDIEVPNLVAFGEDNDGELYLLSLGGQIFRLDAD